MEYRNIPKECKRKKKDSECTNIFFFAQSAATGTEESEQQ